jgi:hypothetical protein
MDVACREPLAAGSAADTGAEPQTSAAPAIAKIVSKGNRRRTYMALLPFASFVYFS